jgi:sugar/nucleoside kinase (ribokinase family)
MATKRIVVLGDLTLDLIVKLPCSFDSINRGSDTLTDFEPRPGGSAANSAIWFSRLGNQSALVSKVGKDFFGELVRSNLKQEAVITHITEDLEHPTGVLIALVEPDGERSFLIKPGANYFLDPTDISRNMFEDVDLFLVSGYAFYRESSKHAAIQAIEFAKSAGVQIAVDPSSAGLLNQFGIPEFFEITSELDILLLNLEEAELLCRGSVQQSDQTQLEHSGQSIKDLAYSYIDQLLSSFKLVGLKLGSCGSASGSKESAFVFAKAQDVNSVDATGCGDAWNAAFLNAHLDNQSLEQCARVATDLATKIVQHSGATPQLD